jgi:hypothetical protein
MKYGIVICQGKKCFKRQETKHSHSPPIRYMKAVRECQSTRSQVRAGQLMELLMFFWY